MGGGVQSLQSAELLQTERRSSDQSGVTPACPRVHNSGFSSFLNDGNEWPEFCSRITPKDACTYAIKVVHFPEGAKEPKTKI
jgi:hypothetical protein